MKKSAAHQNCLVRCRFACITTICKLYAFSLDQRGADFGFYRRMGFGFDDLRHATGGGFAKVLLGYMDGAQRRRKIFAHGQIVKAHNGNILGNAISGFLQCGDCADGNVIIIGKVAGGQLLAGFKFALVAQWQSIRLLTEGL